MSKQANQRYRKEKEREQKIKLDNKSTSDLASDIQSQEKEQKGMRNSAER